MRFVIGLPFLWLGLFFLLVGLGLSLQLLVEQPLLILALTAILVGLKALIVMAIAWVMKLPRAPTLESALLLGPGGEFVTVPRVMLHAAALEFSHPVTKAALQIRSPLPADFEACLRSGRL